MAESFPRTSSPTSPTWSHFPSAVEPAILTAGKPSDVASFSCAMDRKLYLERWLLELKAAAAAAGLETHVRALDGKGGRLLGLEVRRGDDALEFRYWKRRTSARRVVAATSAEIVGRVREVHASIEKERRRVLENGFRRFLRRSIRMLEGLESAFFREKDLLERFRARLTAAKAPPSTRRAAVVRRSRGAPGGYEALPAAAVARSAQIWFAPLLDNQFIDLSSLVRPPKEDCPVAVRSRACPAPSTDSSPVPPSASESLFSRRRPSRRSCGSRAA